MGDKISREEILEAIREVVQDENAFIIEQLEEITEKLDNLSLPGGDYGIEGE